jgi:hypothetical protein
MSNRYRPRRRSGAHSHRHWRRSKAIKVAEIPHAIAVTPGVKTACIASDGSAPVTPIPIVAIAGHR